MTLATRTEAANSALLIGGRRKRAERDAHSLRAVPDSMLPFLAEAAKAAREGAGRKQVHVAAAADLDQSTIFRFERGRSWPTDPDRILRGYADDLELDVRVLWQDALNRWGSSSR